MSQHVPQDLLTAFVEGDVGEQLAVHIAEHLDGCPSCLNRAVALEPLSAAFAALPDPEVPADLIAAVLAEAAQPERVPVTELAVGFALLGAAAVGTALGNPISLAADFGLVLYALGDGARVIAGGLASSGPVLTLVSAVMVAGLLVTARIASPIDPTSLPGSRRLT